ncbi:glycosyltransferase [Vibrio sp. MA40-2]|uniref:glycosyltransferase n=1 Tax=Vibrio sp. MA40-2 TaxID=3391828 RepID=UPI0039A5D078
MRIAYIITGLARGGAEAQLATVSKHLSANHDVAIFSIANNRDLIKRFEGVEVNYFPLTKIANLYHLYKALCKFKPDVLHSHMIHSNILSPIYAKLMSVPCFITSHNTNEGNKMRFEVLKILVKIFKPHVSHVSNKGRLNYLEQGFLEPIELYTNPVSLEKFSLGNTKRNHQVKWINIASLTDQKRHDRLLKVLKKYLVNYPEDILQIVGSGKNFAKIKMLIEEYNLHDNVIMLGPRDDINLLLNESDYFVLSSDWEGLPVSVIESLSSNVPVVSTDCGDISSVVTEGVNGYLAKIGERELLEAMLKARKVDDLAYERLSENSNKSVQRFDVHNVVTLLEELYRSKC